MGTPVRWLELLMVNIFVSDQFSKSYDVDLIGKNGKTIEFSQFKNIILRYVYLIKNKREKINYL